MTSERRKLTFAAPRWLVLMVISLCMSTAVLAIVVLQLTRTQSHLVDCVNGTVACVPLSVAPSGTPTPTP